jgi:hypothetical protein
MMALWWRKKEEEEGAILFENKQARGEGNLGTTHVD